MILPTSRLPHGRCSGGAQRQLARSTVASVAGALPEARVREQLAEVKTALTGRSGMGSTVEDCSP
jgi:hypothetical protein